MIGDPIRVITSTITAVETKITWAIFKGNTAFMKANLVRAMSAALPERALPGTRNYMRCGLKMLDSDAHEIDMRRKLLP